MTQEAAFLGPLIAMIIGHALADYPLQGDFLAKAKNEADPIPGVPWWQAMWAHCAIHAGAVLLITGSAFLAALEFIAHFAIDRAKCMGLISYNTDQFLHVACKILWAAILWGGFT